MSSIWFNRRGTSAIGCSRAERHAILCLLFLLTAADADAGSGVTERAPGPLTPPGIRIVDVHSTPDGPVPRFERLEIRFQISGSSASMMQWPFDPSPPAGIPASAGITVNARFTDPEGRQFDHPAFYIAHFVDEVRDGRDWHLPTGNFSWMVRFTPNRAGTWKYKIVAAEKNGSTESAEFHFSVTPSARRGFIKVSRADPRYFEFDDGTLFAGRGFAFPTYLDDPRTKGEPAYLALRNIGVNLVRVWISSIFGSAWSPWIGGRDQYRGYLPVTGLVPFRDDATGRTNLTMRIDYEAGGDMGWFDACRMQAGDDRESIKPNTAYRVRVRYHGEGISGPRRPESPAYGLVAKLGDWNADCYDPGTGTPVTNYGGDTIGFGEIVGRWHSGSLSFLPRMHLGLENVRQGAAYVESVSVREDLGHGRLGPEMMVKPSMSHEAYVPEERAHALDKIVEIAEQNGVYLKLVVMEKNDKIYFKMEDDGRWVTTGPDNTDGFYGPGRRVNKARWLQQAWWRYLQARWGYSPSIHSWELTNEGDPDSTRHYELTDEFGKFMHCRAFGVEPGAGDRARCPIEHPSAHLVTTSLWHSFPALKFWANPKYPNVDYADLHAYVSTSYAPAAEKASMQWDAARYHLWHSTDVAAWRIGKPVVRGEAGLDTPTEQSETALGLDRDRDGVWLHNFLWSGLDAGALHELYWWNSHIWTATTDHRGQYRSVLAFLADLPLNKGGYVHWGGSVSNPELRVVGQKNTAIGSMHLWVHNRQHTWKHVVDGITVQPAWGEIVVPGFRAATAYAVERWDTHALGGRIAAVETLRADSEGHLRIPVASLSTDEALKIGVSGVSGPPPWDGAFVESRSAARRPSVGNARARQ